MFSCDYITFEIILVNKQIRQFINYVIVLFYFILCPLNIKLSKTKFCNQLLNLLKTSNTIINNSCKTDKICSATDVCS